MRKKGNNTFFLLLIISFAICLQAGCKKEQPPAKQAASPAPAVPPKPTEGPKGAVQKQQSSATNASADTSLDFSKRKDPFKSFIIEKPVVAAGKPGEQKQVKISGKGGDVLPIQSYDVTKFRVSGIITGTRENKALLIDPAGKGYVVKQGMRIGLNNGQITRITTSSLEVLEQYRDDSGRTQRRTIKLTLTPKR